MAVQDYTGRVFTQFLGFFLAVLVLGLVGFAGFGEPRAMFILSVGLLLGLVTLIQPKYGLFIYVVLVFFAPEFPGRKFLPEIREDEFLLVLVLFVAFAKITIQERRFLIVHSPLLAPYTIWVLVCIVGPALASVLRSWNVQVIDYYDSGKYLLGLSSFILAGYLCTRGSDTRRLIRLFLLVGLAVTGVGFIEWLDIANSRELVRSFYPSRRDEVYAIAGFDRITATFRNPNFYALYCAMLVGIVATALSRRVRFLGSLPMLAILVLALFTGFFTLSRSGIGAMVLTLILVLARERRYVLLIIFPLMLLAVAVLVVQSGNWFASRLALEAMQGSFEVRMAVLQNAIAGGVEYPFLGYAIHGYYPFMEGMYEEALLVRGFLGLSVFLFLLWRIHSLLGLLERRSPDPWVRALCAGMHSVYYVFLLVAPFTPFFNGERFSAVFWVLLGASYATLSSRNVSLQELRPFGRYA